MKLSILVLMAVVLGTAAMADDDSARDGVYTCTYKDRSVRATLSLGPARLRVEDSSGELEGSALFRRDTQQKWDEYILLVDTTSYGYYLRFAADGNVTFHYCWSCAAYTCQK